jgi:hypothetical protein
MDIAARAIDALRAAQVNEMGTQSLAMPRGTIVKLVLVLLAVVLAYAWYDGGRESMHDISKPIALPGAAR